MNRKGALLFAAVAVFLLGPSGVARAVTPSQQGWWTAANLGVGPAGGFAPDVPAKGLLVQGGPTGPRAYAALVYDAGAATTGGRLTLQVTSNSITTSGSTLMVCPLTSATLQPEQGGPMADAPAYDCTRSVTATPDGGHYAFDVTPMLSLGTLAVAVLPTGATDRVVFDEPGSDSFVPATEPLPAEADASLPGDASFPGVSFDVGGSAAVPLPTPAATPVAPSTPAPAATSTPAGAPAGALLPVAGHLEDADPLAVVAAIAAALVGAGLWFGARRAAGRAVSSEA